METILLSMVIFGFAIGGLAVGALFGRAPIRGSCGGLACLADAAGCAACPHNREAEGRR